MDREQRDKMSLSVRCPTCGAASGENCELSTGQARTTPHRDRRLKAADEIQVCRVQWMPAQKSN